MQNRVFPLFSFLLSVVLIPQSTHAVEWDAQALDSLLSSNRVGGLDFVKKHPTWDGRGTVIAVLDTGVDMGALGLQSTPTGETKVILVRDFSGQGDLDLEPVTASEEEGVSVLRSDGGVIRGYERPEWKEGSFCLGWIEESAFTNGEVSDLNLNGSAKDRFAVVSHLSSDGKITALVDLDADGDLSDETVFESYEVSHKGFAFRGYDTQEKQSAVTFALYLDPESTHAEIHFDDGGHGSHVAGIAAGYGVHGVKNLNGVAPGAQVMSLKIGNNALAGGATTTGSKRKALEFAAKWARDNDRPIILNLSYGIGSEIEGHSDIDELLTQILQENPEHVFMSTSAGNAGPGISNVGQPAASVLAFSAAAALTPGNARALFGSSLSKDRVFSFSSRGGELVKPDGLLPGVASSSVPQFLPYDIMAGTSMAAPQGAGVHALLLSAAQATGTVLNNGMVRRAMKFSGRPIPGYGSLDQGGGMVHVPSAWDLVTKLQKTQEAKLVLGYETDTPCVTCPHGSAPASYWRIGNTLPDEDDPITFDISPLFSGDLKAEAKAAFFESYRLSSNESWLQVLTPEVYIKGEGVAHAKVQVDPSKLPRRSSAFVGTVSATPRSGFSGKGGTAFELQVVVVVPETFIPSEQYAKSWENESLETGEVDRFFILTPPAATTLVVELEQKTAKKGTIQLLLNDPQGRKVRALSRTTSHPGNDKVRFELSEPTLTPGIWEINTYGSFRNHHTLKYDLKVAYRGIRAPELATLTLPQGEKPSLDGEFTNQYNETFKGYGKGRITGYGKNEFYDVSGDTLDIPFEVEPDMKSATFALKMDPGIYGLFTDVAVTIEDASGKALKKSGFSQSKMSVQLAGAAPGSYVLHVQGALTHESPSDWSVEVDETYTYSEGQEIQVTQDGETGLVLYPGIPTFLEMELSNRPRVVPDGYAHRGTLRLMNAISDHIWLELPLNLSP